MSTPEPALTAYLTKYALKNPTSASTITTTRPYLPSGTARAILHHAPHPLVFSGGHDCHLTSLDGHTYLDFVSEYTAGMFGHSHPAIIAAIDQVTKTGFTLGGANPKEGELARLLVDRFPSIDRLRFCNSGTEANMFALGVGTVFTGRKKILVFDNGYHGGTLSFGAPPSALMLPHEFTIGAYNDTSAPIDADVGVILVEPLQTAGGMIPATRAFLQFLRDEATRVGAVLVFDEVVTSRLHYGGLQEYFGIVPDMTTIGKHFGGGFSFGAFGGTKEIMDLFEPGNERYLPQSGTWNNNVFSMSAGVVAVGLMSREAVEGANRLGDVLREGIQRVFEERGKGVCVTRGFGSAVGLVFLGDDADKWRDLFYFYLLDQGVYIGHRGFLAVNLVHRMEHVERVLEVTKAFCEEFL
ncbi:PLP-dependent transferase [Aspergillus ellipticus CBS 707.79]|uniref:PLP-dependent transferase n=1 Tax=Aspergillus ellipticus CBS 707.79 TaxID=1448320 RepID=A0A319DJP8_9EURO|nr:PLP-dependent transferase [Aspergillus ellipticus CBS 707.79]